MKLKNLNKAAENIQKSLAEAINYPHLQKESTRKIKNGLDAKESLIRSSKLINYIHELTKSELLDYLSINSSNIWRSYPEINETKPEIKLQGFIKGKNQDLMFSHRDLDLNNKELTIEDLDKVINVNIRSQLSSVAKNIDTLMERTFAEPIQLRMKYRDLVMGEVYMIPTKEINEQMAKNNKLTFNQDNKGIENAEKLIDYFIEFSDRKKFKKESLQYHYKYDSVAFFIIDLESNPAKIICEEEDLINFGLTTEYIEKFKLISPVGFEERLFTKLSELSG